MKKEMALHTFQRPMGRENGKWVYETVEREVRVMARAEGYAMVRLKGAMPTVVPERELRVAVRSASTQKTESK